MATRKIVKDGDEILRKVCKPIDNFGTKLNNLLDDMHETMIKADGCGLAAPQVGILRRVAVVEYGDTYLELINPVIIYREGEQTGYEGCLSVPNKSADITRPMIVKVEHYDRNGKKQLTTANGMIARACCHEIDHLDGILFYDYADGGKLANQSE